MRKHSQFVPVALLLLGTLVSALNSTDHYPSWPQNWTAHTTLSTSLTYSGGHPSSSTQSTEVKSVTEQDQLLYSKKLDPHCHGYSCNGLGRRDDGPQTRLVDVCVDWQGRPTPFDAECASVGGYDMCTTGDGPGLGCSYQTKKTVNQATVYNFTDGTSVRFSVPGAIPSSPSYNQFYIGSNITVRPFPRTYTAGSLPYFLQQDIVQFEEMVERMVNVSNTEYTPGSLAPHVTVTHDSDFICSSSSCQMNYTAAVVCPQQQPGVPDGFALPGVMRLDLSAPTPDGNQFITSLRGSLSTFTNKWYSNSCWNYQQWEVIVSRNVTSFVDSVAPSGVFDVVQTNGDWLERNSQGTVPEWTCQEL